MEINKKLAEVQQRLKAPKGQYNSFGKYPYRSCEDILEGLKDVVQDCTVVIKDEVCMIGDRYYVKATASFTDGENVIETTAYAREPENKKGMDPSQITGATSSYARKYALNGLFMIDDNKDADSMDNRQPKQPAQQSQRPDPQPARNEYKPRAEAAVAAHKEMLEQYPDIKKWIEAAMEDGNYSDVVNYFNKNSQG